MKPSRFERVEPLAERVRVADDGVERARGEDRRLRRVGHREHGHRLRLRVREEPVERQRQARRIGFVDGLAPRDRERLREGGFFVEQLLSAVAQPPGFDDRDERRRRQQVGQQVLFGREPREPRLHAVERVALGEALPLLPSPRLGLQELARTRPHLVARQELAHREDPRLRDLGRRALVGDREMRQAVDLVAPEVDAHGMVGGRGVHVDDRAAHRHLTARLDLVLAPVADRDEPGDELVAVDLRALAHDDGFDVLDVRAQALHERAHRRRRSRAEGVRRPCAGAR